MKIVCHDELKYKNKITNPISAEALHIVCIEELEINKKKEKKTRLFEINNGCWSMLLYNQNTTGKIITNKELDYSIE